MPPSPSCCDLLRYVDGDYNDPATFAALQQAAGRRERPLHYLAIPPSLFGMVAEALAKSGSAENARLVIEKPFGHDRASAQALNDVCCSIFPEESIFRIDHYLGKEPVQNIVYTRFANPFFEPIWNRNYVRGIQITMAEDFGVEDRGAFYDETGALRDVVQNHLLQVLAQSDDGPADRRGARGEARPEGGAAEGGAPARPGAASCAASIAAIAPCRGVRAGLDVETFVAVKLFIDSWRWAGVPIYIRAGKRLPLTATEVRGRVQAPAARRCSANQ